MATSSEILAEFRTAVAAIHTTRVPAAFFVEASTDEEFRRPPLKTKERFRVEPGPFTFLEEFGRAGYRMVELEVQVSISHPPLDPSKVSGDYVAADREHIADVLENRSWSTSGIDAVWFARLEDDGRADADWQVSTLAFRVVYTGPAVSS